MIWGKVVPWEQEKCETVAEVEKKDAAVCVARVITWVDQDEIHCLLGVRMRGNDRYQRRWGKGSFSLLNCVICPEHQVVCLCGCQENWEQGVQGTKFESTHIMIDFLQRSTILSPPEIMRDGCRTWEREREREVASLPQTFFPHCFDMLYFAWQEEGEKESSQYNTPRQGTAGIWEFSWETGEKGIPPKFLRVRLRERGEKE